MSMNIPGYSVLHVIALGGLGVVYLAIQQALDRQVALKVLPAAPARKPALRKAFLDEGKVVAKLNHPHIITLYDLGHTAGAYYISMEYIPWKNLKARIEDGLVLKESLEIMAQLARALGYAHRHGVVHRDIKPTNVLFRDDRFPVWTDFGVAKLHDEGILLNSGQALIATPSYVPPERVRGEPEDVRSDLYSLGVLFHEMLLGFPPYPGEDAQTIALKHVHEPIPRLPEVLAFLQPILDRLLAKDPGERFRDTQELIQSLEDIARSSGADGAALPKQLDDQVTLLVKRTRDRGDRSEAADPARDGGHAAAYDRAPAHRVSRSRRLLGRAGWVGAGAAAVMLWHYGLAPRFFNALDPQAEHVLQQLLSYEGTRPVESLLGELGAESRYATYTFALAVLHGHPRAIEGLKQLATRFEARARQEWRRGHLEQALRLVQQGLHFQPRHQGFATLESFMRRTLWEKQRREIMAALLAKAEGQMQEARLIESKGDNAFDTYNAVLLLDRESREAREGLARVSQKLGEDAENARKTGDLQRSLMLVDQGLRVDPKAGELHTLKETVARDRRELGERHERLIAGWLDRAKAQLGSGRLTTPPGDNAFETYRMLLAVAPGQGEAQAGLTQIAERCLQLAEEARRSDHADASRAFVEQGLQAVPGHARLAALRSTLGAGQAEIIEGLLRKAEQQFVASRLTAPRGDNALETYRAILDRDPGNARAHDGLAAIAGNYHTLAEDRQRAGDLSGALSLVDEGLKARPQDEGLLGQKQAIQAKLTAQQAAR